MDLAAARLYDGRFAIVRSLLKDPAHTLYRLSTEPSEFGKVRAELKGEKHRAAVQDLITAAKAYLVSRRRNATHAVDQGELGLPLPRSRSSKKARQRTRK
jgi:hypothetical protein